MNSADRPRDEITITKENKILDNVWDYPVGGHKDIGHPAIFPEKLAEDHILSWSNEEDTVLDPMCGSGTTLKMAKKLNRNATGIEISPEYCEIARRRLEQGDFIIITTTMKTPTDRLSEFDEQFTEIVQVRPKILKQLDPKIKHHLIQTILVLQEQKAVVEGKMLKNRKKGYDYNNLKSAEDYYSFWAKDWREIIRYEEGLDRALSDYKHSLEETIKEWEKMV